MSNQTLKSFIDLVTFDQNLINIQRQIIQLQNDLDSKQTLKYSEQQRIEQCLLKKQEAQKILQDQEVLVADLQQQENRLTHHVESLTSSKGYDVTIKELEKIRLERNQQEKKMIQFINRVQSIDKELTGLMIDVDKNVQLLEQSIDVCKNQLEQLQEQCKVIAAGRSEKTIGIPMDLLDTYELMKDRVVDPVVPLLQDSCSVCFYGVTPRDLQLIKHNSMIQCKDCYRFLYESTMA